MPDTETDPFRAMLAVYLNKVHDKLCRRIGIHSPSVLTDLLSERTAQLAAARQSIADFEFRAGCRLEHIPVEALGKAQDVYVNQQAVDTLKAENERLTKQLNAAVSEAEGWRGRYKESRRSIVAGPDDLQEVIKSAKRRCKKAG